MIMFRTLQRMSGTCDLFFSLVALLEVGGLMIPSDKVIFSNDVLSNDMPNAEPFVCCAAVAVRNIAPSLHTYSSPHLHPFKHQVGPRTTMSMFTLFVVANPVL